MSDPAALAVTLAATAATAAAILVEDRRRRSVAPALALALAAVLVAGEAWDGQLRDLRDQPLLFAAALLGSGALLAGIAVAFRRWPILVPIALVAALPVRVPVEAGGESSNLLVPLYAVIAAAVLAGLYEAWRGEGEAVRLRLPRALRITVAVVLVLYALQAIYSEDVSRATQNVAFFLVPFAVMMVLLAEVRWDRRLLGLTLGVILTEAVVFAAIGIWQHETGKIFWNDVVRESNEFHFYVRVNSLFWDSNIYGRYLALAALIGMAVLLWTKETRRFAALATAITLIWLGLVFGFSQTSFAALLAGLTVLAALRWSLRGTMLAGGALAAAAAVFLLAFGSVVEFDLSSATSVFRSTSGRTDLIGGGTELALDRPIWGHGSGSFADEFKQRNDVPEDDTVVSHTEPITVAAEQGILGLAAYLALLAVALAMLFSGASSIAPGLGASGARASPGTISATPLARIAVAAAFVALIVHTLGYAAYLNDPLTWALLAIGGALASGE